MFGTQIDRLYDEQHMNNTFLIGNSNNNHHSTNNVNQTGNNDTNNNGGGTTTTVVGQGLGGHIHTTAISGINVNEMIVFI
jgi:hypothetical protein